MNVLRSSGALLKSRLYTDCRIQCPIEIHLVALQGARFMYICGNKAPCKAPQKVFHSRPCFCRICNLCVILPDAWTVIEAIVKAIRWENIARLLLKGRLQRMAGRTNGVQIASITRVMVLWHLHNSAHPKNNIRDWVNVSTCCRRTHTLRMLLRLSVHGW